MTRSPLKIITLLALPLLPQAAPALNPETHKVTITDLPTNVTVSNTSEPLPADHAAFGLFPEIAVGPVEDRRVNAKPCFGSAEEDRRIVGAVIAQALSAAGYSVLPSASLTARFSIDELECASGSRTERHTAWRLSGHIDHGPRRDRLVDVTIKGGRSVESDFPPGVSDNFRDIDTPQGAAAASLRDRLADMFRSRQLQPR